MRSRKFKNRTLERPVASSKGIQMSLSLCCKTCLFLSLDKWSLRGNKGGRFTSTF